DGLVSNNVWALCEAPDGSLWVGTDGGLTHISKSGISHYTKQQGLPRNPVLALAVDQTGVLWVGTGGGLCSISDTNVTSYSPADPWYLWKTRAVVAAHDGTIWIGTNSGLYRMKRNRLVKFTTAHGLPATDIRAIVEDRSGNIWIGTCGGGLCQIDAKLAANLAESIISPTLPVSIVVQSFTTNNGLSNNSVWALHQDSEGVLWIGTEKGLNRLQNGSITRFTTDQGLPDNLVNAIVEDDFGHLWIGHDRGIYRVAKQQLQEVATGVLTSVLCDAFTESDGLLSLETNGQKSQPAAIKTRDGKLCFATTQGVAVLEPRNVPKYNPLPKVVIEQIRVDGIVVFDNGPPARENDHPATPYPLSIAVSSDLPLDHTEIRFAPGWGSVLEVTYTA
ncbi:MAG: hypothetical protein N3G20_11915, partial [Verrucomicrobiae bacterium]|nr:hypothetical protein [Verrucomicrobiae bacterium]